MTAHTDRAKRAADMRERRAAMKAGTWMPRMSAAEPGESERRARHAAYVAERRAAIRAGTWVRPDRLRAEDASADGRKCRICEEFKPWDAFHRGSGVNGRRANCAQCGLSSRTGAYRDPDYQRRQKYGLAPGEYDRMRAAQGHACMICGTAAELCSRGTLYVDHDHATGRVRGLLCHRCNLGLAFVEDSGFVKNATRYLRG